MKNTGSYGKKNSNHFFGNSKYLRILAMNFQRYPFFNWLSDSNSIIIRIPIFSFDINYFLP